MEKTLFEQMEAEIYGTYLSHIDCYNDCENEGEYTMNFETEKAWMVRSDGVAFPCICHIYASKDDIEETLYAAQWLYGHTANAKTKDLCLRLFKTYGLSLSEHRNCARNILLHIKKTPYRFLNYDFVLGIADEIQNAADGDLLELNLQVNHALNNEFLRVRYGGMYDSEDDNRDLYFRLSNDGLLTPEWNGIIQAIIREHKDEISEIIIVSDKESTGECKKLLTEEKK